MKIAPALSIAVAIFVGVTGCGSDDGEAPVESRIKNSTSDPALVNEKIDPKDLLPKADKELPDIGLLRPVAEPPLRNPNMQIRSDPPIGKADLGPWNQSTIEPDKHRDYDREEKLDSMRYRFRDYRESNKLINDNINRNGSMDLRGEPDSDHDDNDIK